MIGIMIILLSLFNQKYSIAFKEQHWWSTGVQNYLFISNYVVEKNLRIIQTLFTENAKIFNQGLDNTRFSMQYNIN